MIVKISKKYLLEKTIISKVLHISEVKRVIYFYLKQQLEIEKLLYDMNHTNSEY